MMRFVLRSWCTKVRSAPGRRGHLAGAVALAGTCCALLGSTLLGHTSPAAALDPGETDARKIAEAAEARNRGDRRVARVKMTLSSENGRTRERRFISRSMKFGDGEKSIIQFSYPAQMRNTGLLTFDYDDGARNDDQWLYLPNLRTSKRISTTDKSGSFLGSDLTYSDMTRGDVDQWSYTMVDPSVRVAGEECWILEARPRTRAAKEQTGYLKIHVWISKTKLMPLQSKAWVGEGQKLKYTKYEDIKRVGGIWTTHLITVRTVRGNAIQSSTVLEFASVRYADPSISETEFSARRLERGL